MIVTMTIKNITAESLHTLTVDQGAIAHILIWYGSHCAGDDYSVRIDCVPISLDLNGEREFDTIDA